MDDITIINSSLSRIGCLPLQSILAPGPQGQGPFLTYRAVTEFNMSIYPWHFIKAFAALSRETETPGMGWTSQFILPPDRLALPRAYYPTRDDERPLTRFQISGNKVLTGTAELFCEYPKKWDPA